MSKRSRSSLGSNLITGWSVTHWAATPRGRQYPQPEKTAGTFRPLERGLQSRLENDIHIVLIGQIREAWLDPAITSRFIFQPFQSLLHKPLYPLIGMATAH